MYCLGKQGKQTSWQNVKWWPQKMYLAWPIGRIIVQFAVAVGSLRRRTAGELAMSAKRKNQGSGYRTGQSVDGNRRQLDRARQAHAKGAMCKEDFIWSALQCYAKDLRTGTHKSSRRFA